MCSTTEAGACQHTQDPKCSTALSSPPSKHSHLEAQRLESNHLHFTSLHIQTPEIDMTHSKFDEDGAQGHAGNDSQLADVHTGVPLLLEAFTHELVNPACGAGVHKMDILMRVAGSYMEPYVFFAV